MHASLPTHPTKRHPLTGEPLRALWVRPDGRACWPMMGGSEDPSGDGGDGAADKPDGDKPENEPPADKPLGENGEKALRAERDARKALETQLGDLKKGLASALGVESGDGKPSTDDALMQVQTQLAEMRHENAVLALANAHGITDVDDLAILRATRDAEALTKLAARLAVDSKDGGGEGGGRRIPRPDHSQGSGSSESKASVSTGRDLFAARRGKKSV